MRKSRNEFSYSGLKNQIVLKLSEATKTLKDMRYESKQISPREFYDYLTGETPTGDTITLADVLDNEFLMVHEVVEISELKKMRIPINKQTVMNAYSNVVEAHYTATEHELDYAANKKDHDWLKVRIKHAKSWLEDDNIPQHLILRCKSLIKKLSETLESIT